MSLQQKSYVHNYELCTNALSYFYQINSQQQIEENKRLFWSELVQIWNFYKINIFFNEKVQSHT